MFIGVTILNMSMKLYNMMNLLHYWDLPEHAASKLGKFKPLAANENPILKASWLNEPIAVIVKDFVLLHFLF